MTDVNTFLLSQFINWSSFSRCKSWKTYTLPDYDSVLREMVKLVTVESKHKNFDYCELFLIQPFDSVTSIPEIIKEWKQSLFGKTFLEKRTTSCEYHFDKSVNKYQRLVSDEDKIGYQNLASGMKNAVSEYAYIIVQRLTGWFCLLWHYRFSASSSKMVEPNKWREVHGVGPFTSWIIRKIIT